MLLNFLGCIPRRKHRLAALLLVLAAALLASTVPAQAARREKVAKPASLLLFRCRTIQLTPSQPAMIHWRYGGEGLGGDPVSDVVTRELPAPPQPTNDESVGELEAMLDGPPTDRIIVKGDTHEVHFLNPGVWSRPHPLRELRSHFMTFMITGHRNGTALTECVLEFEVSYDGKVVKTFTVAGPDGPTFGVVNPLHLLGENDTPTPEFVAALGSLHDYARAKQELLKAEPFITWPTPKLSGVLSDCSGYGAGQGYKTRTADKATLLAEVEVLRLMGMNGFRSTEGFVADMVRQRVDIGAHFARVRLTGAGGGFPIPGIDHGDGRAPFRHVGDGCPYLPANANNIVPTAQANFKQFFAQAVASGAEEVWGLTIDEIGSVFHGANEGGNHPGSCPYCSEAFRTLVRADGRTLEDFGAKSWDEVRPTPGYWTINYWDSHRILTERVAVAQRAMEQATSQPLSLKADVSDFSLEEKKPVDHAQALMDARARLEQLEWSSKILQVPEDERKTSITGAGWHLLEYCSKRFMEQTSAQMFKPIRQLVQAKNQEQDEARKRGETDTAAAKQPRLYVFGLRQPKFTWGGDSLGMFEYYRHGDTAMVYETSNRDTRVHQWDSYMNDVGRSLQRFNGVDFGIYVKPHRGAPVQRALSAATRGAKMLYWYTYGPEWGKGDSFGGRADIRAKVAYANRLVAATEEVLTGGQWALPAQVAVVRPRTAEYFSGSASWENGKWVYMALAHAQIPVDPLDEILLETADLSAYKVIVISGIHLRRKTAQRMKQWVADGGTLYTCGFGMAKDEAGRPLQLLHEMFGVKDRSAEIPQWGSVPRYGATSLGSIGKLSEPPGDAQVTGKALLQGSHSPRVGCEILQPAAGAQVLASNAANQPIALSHGYGKGQAYLIGTFAGLEYAAEVMDRRPYDPAKRSWLTAPVLAAGVVPVAQVSDPLVEAVLIENQKSGKQVLVLLNWQWNREAALLRDVTVKFRGFGQRRTLRSIALQRELPATVEGDWMTFKLPELKEGDAVMVE